MSKLNNWFRNSYEEGAIRTILHILWCVVIFLLGAITFVWSLPILPLIILQAVLIPGYFLKDDVRLPWFLKASAWICTVWQYPLNWLAYKLVGSGM